MAIPTSFIICTPNATVTKVTPMLGHGSPVSPVNLVLMDIAGTLTPKTIVLDANMSIIMSAAFTDAQVAAALQRYLQEVGKKTDGSAGGNPVPDSKQIATALSTCT
jgi:hypothetical protein